MKEDHYMDVYLRGNDVLSIGNSERETNENAMVPLYYRAT